MTRPQEIAVPAVVLVDGDDAALVGDAVRELVDRLVGAEDRGLVVEEHGDGLDLAAVADACRTPPFLASRRVVVVRDVHRFSTAEVAPLLAYLELPSPTTALVLVADRSGAADGARLAPKLAAAVKAHGQVVATAVSGREAAGWIRERVRGAAVNLDPAAESLVAAHLGEDLGRLGTLLEILEAAYGEGARLGSAEVEPYLGEAGSVAPWDLTDAIDEGRTAAALEVLTRLLHAGERHPLVVLATLTRHVQARLRVQSPAIRSEAAAAAALGIAKGRSTFPARKALAAAQRMGPAGVAEAIGLVGDADLALKGAIDWPPELVLEILVARLCRLARLARPAGRPAAAARPSGRKGR